LQRAAACCSVLHPVYSYLHTWNVCGAVCCTVLQRAAACCSVFQCVAFLEFVVTHVEQV